MKVKTYRDSLFWKISASFLIILILLGLSYVSITAYSTRKYYQETTQRVNANVAEHMLKEVNPFVDRQVNKEALGKIMHSMMAVNPYLEVYLLDEKGEILSYVVLDKKVRLNNVNISPIKQFIASAGDTYVLGDDPRNPGHKTIFSATEVLEDGEFMGYVYMVLASEKFEDIAGSLSTAYLTRIGTQSFVLTLVAAFSIGLILIALLTRNLRKIIQTVNRFEDGDYHARIPVQGKGELANLSNTFNQMADTILKNIDELKKVDKLRRDLIANVSHDLRSPMAVIHGYIETLMLKEESLSPEQRKKYLQIVLDSSDKLKTLVADLFELSKLEAEQVKVNRETFSLSQMMLDARQHYQILADQKNISIKTEMEEGDTVVYADNNLIQRVMQNLLDNAIKYTPENGEVELRAQTKNQQVEIVIRNTGKGIPEKDLPNIFNRYYMVDKDKSGITGTGLGLAIVKKIMDIHQSIIKVSSKTDEWTTFSFTLPLNRI
jgi:signal transduction histidine kinase